MRILWRFLRGLGVLVLCVLLLLAAPILYVEAMCRGTANKDSYASLLPEQHHRSEARTFMTYPEWHIVHAYDDYAQVISTGDPHDFGFFRAITGYWSSLCALTKVSANHGGVNTETKQLVYVIGTSFSLELVLKAAYEETIGRIATVIRGDTRAPLDDLSARQATEYARFLQQVPWYKWDFRADALALKTAATGVLRDRERVTALGLEYGAKAAYAQIIAQAVQSTGQDALSLRLIITGMRLEELAEKPGIKAISERPDGVEIEVPRYRKLTYLLGDLASDGASFVEIAGNDDILLTAVSVSPAHPGAIHSFKRQGYGDYRHLIALKVTDLADLLRSMRKSELTLEHIHDY